MWAWVDLVYAAVLSLLLFSNVWLLRELESLKRQLEAYQHEVGSLDDRVCQLMYAVEEATADGQGTGGPTASEPREGELRVTGGAAGPAGRPSVRPSAAARR